MFQKKSFLHENFMRLAKKMLRTAGKATVVAPFSGLFFLHSLHCDVGKRERGEGIFLNGVVGAWDEGWIRHPRFPAR